MTDRDTVDGGRVDQDGVGVESGNEGGPGADAPARSRRLWWVWALLALVVVLVGAYASTRSGLLDVDELLVEIETSKHERTLIARPSRLQDLIV